MVKKDEDTVDKRNKIHLSSVKRRSKIYNNDGTATNKYIHEQIEMAHGFSVEKKSPMPLGLKKWLSNGYTSS